MTGVTEESTRTFADHWTGTGEILLSGDSEKLCLDAGEYMESEVFITDTRNISILQNFYIAGDDATLKYRHGATQVACEGASWISYAGSFESLGYVQIRLEA